MINWTLYWHGMKGSWKTLLIFTAVILLYFVTVIPMFDPALGSALDEFAKAMPELMSMVGMNPASNSLISFLSAYLYGFIMLVFPMVFSILCANRLIASHVDRGSMTYLLASPVKRSTVAFTQMKVLATGVFVLIVFATILGIINCAITFPGELDVSRFILLNVGVLCLQLFIAGICFLCSCTFNDSKYAVGFGAGIPALGFVLQMMADAGDKLKAVRFFTFFTLFDPNGVVAGETIALWNIVILFIGAILLFTAAIFIFTQKDLHI
jgi:ABC-2 type transport system permease protein